MCRDTKSNPKSSAPYFTSSETLLLCQGSLWVKLNLFHRYLGIGDLGEFWKLGPSTPNHVQGHIKSNLTKFSGPNLTSNEVLLLCQGHLRVQLYLCYWYSTIRAIWGNRAQTPPNHVQGHLESNPKSLTPHFISNEALL